jgi:hypothetical protein
VGDVIVSAAAVVSRVTVTVSVAVLPAASRAVMVSTFVPVCRPIPLAVQFVAPVAVPLPPRLFAHRTWVTPMLSDAVPPSVRDDADVRKVELVVGEVIATVGGTVSGPGFGLGSGSGLGFVPMPVPLSSRETRSPEALKLRSPLAVADVVGAKPTVTVWVALVPLSVNDPPDTILKGGDVDTVPVTVPPRGLDIVKVRVTTLPRFTLPKLRLPVGLTAKATCATAFTTGEQSLSLPLASTALTATK